MKKVLALLAAAVLLIMGCCACGAKTEGGETEGTNTPAAPKTKVINYPLSEEKYAFAIAKENTELVNQVNAYLTQIQGDGTFDAICDKYFGDGTPAEITSAKKDKSKDQLVVATSTGFAPFEMVDNGKFSGIDLEIADGLAKYLNKELVIEDMQFASVCTSVQQGLCDIGMAGLTVTPAREAILTFSNSYYNASQVLVVKGDNTEFDACTDAAGVEAILNAKTADTKVGCQNGTTGAIYIEGDEADPDGYGFKGLKVTQMTYDYAALAVTAMLNGEIDYVIVDNAPAAAIVKSVNG